MRPVEKAWFKAWVLACVMLGVVFMFKEGVL